MDKISAIVVTYNRIEFLKKCIEKLQNQTVSLDILVIDNASTDGTGALFRSCDTRIKYFNTGANLGGAGGFGFGIKKAVELGYELLWILDDDTMPEPDALEELLNKDRELSGNYGFLSSRVLWKDDSICAMNVQKNTKWKNIKNFEEMQSVQYASFVSLFIRSGTVKKVGLPYKEFFIWTDDWEYTRRISKMKKCYYIPTSVVHHWCKSNDRADIITTSPERLERFKYLYRNDVVLYRLDGIDGKIYLSIRILVHKIKIYKDGKNVKEKIKLINDAIKEGKRFFPKIEYLEN